MKPNDRLIAVAIGSVLVVGAFLVCIIIGLPDSGGSSVRAQESTTPTPKPAPTGEDFDRWEKEWDAKGRVGLRSMNIQGSWVIPEGQSATGRAQGQSATAGAQGQSATGMPQGPAGFFNASQPGDRVLKFTDGSSVALPAGVEISRLRIVLVSCIPGKQCLQPPFYELKKGEDNVLTVDIDGTVSEYSLNNTVSDPSAFAFLTSDDED